MSYELDPAPGPYLAKWPVTTISSCRWAHPTDGEPGWIKLVQSVDDPDEGPDRVLHEMGHNVMWNVWNYHTFTASNCSDHYFDKATSVMSRNK